MGKDGVAIPRQTSRGVVWTCSGTPKEYYGFKTRFEVRDMADKGVVIMLGEDGMRGMDDVDVIREGDKLLNRRWEELRLMDFIVDSPKFAAGDFKGSIEAAFKRMDEGVEKLVGELKKSRANWSKPIMWRACYNSVVVVVTAKEVFMAGAGSFRVRRIGGNDVVPLSPCTRLISNPKSLVVCGYPDNRDGAENAEYLRTDKHLFFYNKYELKKNRDECIVMEQLSAWSRTGVDFFLEHDKNWGIAMAEASDFYNKRCKTCHFGAVLLALDHPQESVVCSSGGAASTLVPRSLNEAEKGYKKSSSEPILCA